MRPGLFSHPLPLLLGHVRWLAVCLSVVGWSWLQAAEAAAQVSSTECCVQLLFPMGARAVSLGQSLTARPSRDGVFYNPASLSGIGQDAFVVHHETTFDGQNNAVSLLVDAGLAGTFGLSFVLIDGGESEATNTGGEQTGTLSIRWHQLLASFATPVRGGLRAGVSYKLFNGGYYCAGNCNGSEGTGTTHLLDLGVQFRPPVLTHLELGAALTHVGFAFQQKNAEQDDPTPARIRFGAAYELAHHLLADSLVTLWLSADVVNRFRAPTKPILGVGAELAFDRTIFVRAGYSGSGDGLAPASGGGLGVGIRYQRYTIDVAKQFLRGDFQTEGEPFLVSVGISF